MSKVLINDSVGIQSTTNGHGLQVDTSTTLSTLTTTSDVTVGGNTTLSGTYLTMAGVTQTGGRKQIISTGVVLTSAESGAVLIPGGSAQTFTLPAPAQGLHFKMYAATAAAHKIQVPAGAAKIYGNAININNAQSEKAEGQQVAAAISVAFGVAYQTGDFIEVVCNGTHWFLHAVTNDPLTITT
jgi:hypothetical protein